MAIQIRRYQPADHDAVWHLHHVALLDAGAHAGSGPWDDDLHRIETVYLEGGEFLVGTLDGRIVAMGAIRPTAPERAEVKRMRVLPECQRRGYGEQILLALEARARELGYRTLHLDTTVVQVAAQALYRKHGYVETGRIFLLGIDSLLFEKRLGEESA